NTGVLLALSEQPKWSVAASNPGNFQIFNESNGQNALWINTGDNNVGIGTNSPVEKLHVSGTGVVRARINSDSNPGFTLALNDFPKSTLASPTGFGANGYSQLYNETISNTAIWVTPSTNDVGIGPFAPSGDKLHVAGTIAVETLGAAGSTGLCRNSS